MDPQTTKKFILIADDNKLIARVLANKLTAVGYDIVTVQNGDEALQTIATRKPDLLLLDLIMPVKDGFNTLKEIRANPAYNDLKVIATSDLQQVEDVERVKQLGVLAFFGKENIQDLVDAVPQYLA